MEIVAFIWIIMLSIIGIQIFSIIRFVKKGESVKFDDSYSDEAIEKTKIIVDAIRTNKIKKHILTNSAPIYDSKKTLLHYKNFLESELMKELSLMKEGTYNG